ncbi:MAG: hypothetical protein IKB64_00645 [Paludibacteraceae bacterium]|nr:hypothetical protein [Paludibacteraceae bacterium]
MLKNADIRQLSKTATLLSMLSQYFIDLDDNNLYEQTGITIKDIQGCISALNHIHTTETLKHIRASEKSNAWNKAHPEQHRKHSRESGRKRYNDKKGGGI